MLLLFGPENALYNRLKNRYESEHVKFLGYIKGDEKLAILKNTDIFVLVSYSEGLPMAVLEAIGCGCKVVISKECNIDDIEELKVGVYAKHKPENIEKAFYKVANLSKEDDRKKLLEKYSWEKSAKILEKFLNKYRGG